MSQRERGERFRALHEGEPFVIPNAWDAGFAYQLSMLRFPAVATTSSGFAFTRGTHDGAPTLDEIAEHVRLMCTAIRLPVSVDLEDGREDPAEAIRRVAEAGAVGASIEDYVPQRGVIPAGEAADRVAAAVQAARALDFPFTVTARAENQIRGGHRHGFDDTLARLQAYERAGADVLYAPGLKTTDEIRAVCAAVSRPVNVLGHAGFASTAEIFAAGAQRVSVGGALTWVAVAAASQAAERLRDGDLSVLDAKPPVVEP
jgi:2-methylisocitrate lyase-like PEP mutase family enzyme